MSNQPPEPKIIHFENEKSYELCSLKPDRMYKPPFNDVFLKAFLCLHEIVQAPANQNKSNEKDISFFYDVMEINNIIAFTGDRGTGKTTAMLNFVNVLQLRNKENLSEVIKNILPNEAVEKNDELSEDIPKAKDSIPQYRYCSLPVIDPSKLSQGESLIGVIIARIYDQIRKMLDNKDIEYVENFRNSIRKCEEAYQAICNMHQSNKEDFKTNLDDLEHLSMLATTTRMRKSLNELVMEYLELCKEHDDKASINHRSYFLVIPIDDLDTNIRIGYTLAEEIRSFLLIPKVIIAMSLKLEQLADLVEQQFIADFDKLLNKDHVLDAEPAEMAVKYIEKLVPVPRRISMPVFHIQNINTLNVTTQKQKTKDYPDGVDFVDYLFRLIKNTTGILLTRDNHDGHPLIPFNLRAIRQLLDFLEGLESVTFNPKPGDSQKKTLSLNLDKLEEWLLDSVCSNSVPRGMANIIRQVAAHPNQELNAFLLRLLDQYGIQEKLRAMDREGKISYCGLFGTSQEVRSILRPETRPENISLGDVLFLLQRMQEVNSSDGIRHFAAAVKMLYSIRITRLLYTEKEPLYKEVQSLIGGLIYNPALHLTMDGMEWIRNAETSGAKYYPEEDNTVYLLDGTKPKIGEEEREDTASTTDAAGTKDTPMSLDQTMWLSFFVVAYRGRPTNELHNFMEGAYQSSRYPRAKRRDDEVGAWLSINWMGFATASLTPIETVNRLFWLANAKSNIFTDQVNKVLNKIFIDKLRRNLEDEILNKEYIDKMSEEQKQEDLNKEFINKFHEDQKNINRFSFILKMYEWLDNNFMPLPLNNVDIINDLISYLHNNRYDMIESPDEVAGLRGFFLLRKALIEGLGKVLEKTALKSKENEKELYINRLKKCPCMDNNNDYIGTYRQNENPEEGRCFDWFVVE